MHPQDSRVTDHAHFQLYLQQPLRLLRTWQLSTFQAFRLKSLFASKATQTSLKIVLDTGCLGITQLLLRRAILTQVRALTILRSSKVNLINKIGRFRPIDLLQKRRVRSSAMKHTFRSLTVRFLRATKALSKHAHSITTFLATNPRVNLLKTSRRGISPSKATKTHTQSERAQSHSLHDLMTPSTKNPPKLFKPRSVQSKSLNQTNLRNAVWRALYQSLLWSAAPMVNHPRAVFQTMTLILSAKYQAYRI